MTPQEERLLARLNEAFARDDQETANAIAAILDREDGDRRARLAGPDALANAAAWYAAQGIAVFPLREGEKTPLTVHGFKDATADLTTVKAWWAKWPQANIGLPTGRQFDVIDVDPPDGWRSLAEARAAAAIPETIGYAITPRGAHLYVAPTGDGNATGLMPGIDYRGLGGYVVAPPSRADGGMWEWSTPLALS